MTTFSSVIAQFCVRLVAAGCLVMVAPAAAQTEDGASRVAAVRAVEAAILKIYVFPALKPALIAKLEEALKAHRYDGVDLDIFAQRATEDLQAVSHDGHLYLDHDPGRYAALLAPPKGERGMAAYYRTVAIAEHSGLTKLEILPANIRYLKITAFHWTPKLTRRAYDDAAQFLKDGAAIIIDLRENGGGDSSAADYFNKALIQPNQAKPIYILIDGHVASAAEAVAYGVQQAKQGVIVGSTSYGAANNNKKVPIAPDLVLSVSYNRPINRISGTNWEGVGVVPDLAVPASTALEAAELAALDRLSKAPDATGTDYRWARAGIMGRLHPLPFDPARRKTLAGKYATIELRDSGEGLRLYRSDRPRWQPGLLLTAMAEDGLFAVEGTDELRIRLTSSELVLLHGSEDAREVFPRDPAQPPTRP